MAETVPAAVRAAPDNRATPAAQNTPRILVVEDDAKMRRVLELLLSGHWTVETAADARAALAIARERPPDLVLTDLRLPGMDGFDFLRQLRAEAGTRTLPVIVISGLTEEADRLQALEAGANDYLIKPFSERELMLRVTTHLEMGFLRREAALRESETQLRAVLEGALDAVVGMDAGGLVIDWNQQAASTFGYTPEEAIGRRLAELIIPPEVRPQHQRGLEKYFETGEAPLLNRRVEVEGQRKDGTRIPIELSITVVKGWGFYRFNAFVRDISDRRAADAERNRLLEEAREANRMKDEFLATLSHELRTPLNAIVGWTQLLRTGSLDEPTAGARHRDHRPQRASRRPSSSRTSSTSRASSPASSASTCARSTWSALVEAAFDTVAPPPRPRASACARARSGVGPLSRLGDPDRLQQVVWNLLSNAIKFTPKGGEVACEVAPPRGTPTSSSSCTTPAWASRRSSCPTSSSASARRTHRTRRTRRARPRPVHRAPPRRAARRQRGRHQRRPGPGHDLHRAPAPARTARRAENARVPPVAHEEEGLEASPRLDGVRVLVVEDEADARDLLAAVLQKRGARVFTASSATEALEVLPRERPDVLLSDIALPDMDGYELIRKVRSLPAGPRRPHPRRRPHRLRPPRGPHARAVRRVPAPRRPSPSSPRSSSAVVASLAGKSAR